MTEPNVPICGATITVGEMEMLGFGALHCPSNADGCTTVEIESAGARGKN
jgi:hypothetical protein